MEACILVKIDTTTGLEYYFSLFGF